MNQAPNPSRYTSKESVVQWIDARELECPQPLLLARKALAGISVGEVLGVYATDPHSQLDFEVYCIRTGHQLLDCHELDGVWTLLLRKMEADRKLSED